MSLTEISNAISEASKDRHRKIRIQVLTMEDDLEQEQDFIVKVNEAHYLFYAFTCHRDWIISGISYMWQRMQEAANTALEPFRT